MGEDLSKPLIQWSYGNFFYLRIVVKLIAGEHGEYSRRYEFELKSDDGYFRLEYLTEEKKQRRNQHFVRRIIELVSEGEGLFGSPVKDWEEFYGAAHVWRSNTGAVILRNMGLEEELARFTSTVEIRPYPHQSPEGSHKTVDEYYTQFLNLCEIAEELAQGVPPLKPRTVRVSIPKHTKSGSQSVKAEIIRQLSAFAEEGDALLLRGTGTEVDWPRAKEWAGKVEAYIRENISEDAAAWFSLSTTEGWPGWAVDRRYVDWIHTRIRRLDRLASEVRTR